MALAGAAAGNGAAEVVVLGLGTNRSYGGMTCPQLLESDCQLLSQRVAGLVRSSLYRTAPMYYHTQEDFWNMVVAGRFSGRGKSAHSFTSPATPARNSTSSQAEGRLVTTPMVFPRYRYPSQVAQ